MKVKDKKQIIYMLLGQGLTMFFSLLLPAFLSRILDPNGFGVYSQFNLLLFFFVSFLGFGFSAELFYFFPNESDRQKKNIIIYCFVALIILGCVAGITMYFTPLYDFLVSEVGFNIANILIVVVMLSLPSNIMNALYVVKNDNLSALLYQPIFAASKLILLICGVCFFSEYIFIYYAFLLLTIVQFLFVLMYVCVAIKKIGGRVDFDPDLINRQINYMIPLGLGNSLKVFLDQMDRLIILWSVSASSFAVYAIAIFGVPGLQQIYLTFSQVYLKNIVLSIKNNDEKNALLIYRNMFSIVMSYTIPVLIFSALYSRHIIIFMFSDKYSEASDLYSLYLLVIFFSAFGSGIFIKAMDKNKYLLFSYALTILTSMPLTLLLVSKFSLLGGVCSAILSSALQRILLAYFDSKVLKISLMKMFPVVVLFKIIAVTAICSVLVLSLDYFFDARDGFYTLARAGTIYFLSWFLLMRLLKVLKNE